jgi:hypothetical protein
VGPSDAAQGSPEASADALPEDSSPSSDAATGDGGGNGACDLSAMSVLINPTLMYTSGTDPVDCPSAANHNIQSSSCALQPTGMCTANATCSVAVNNAGSTGLITETGTVTVTGSTATGSVSYSDSSGVTCFDSISGPVTVGTGTPGACMQTCSNGTPNGETGCNPCLMKACASAYAACLADNTSGCINCNQLLSGTAGTGIQCNATAQLVFNLLACGCSPATCD